MRPLAAALLLLLPLILFGKALIGREAFLPAQLLDHLAPWEREPQRTAWNVLRFDGITQFYPWRLEAGRQIRAGKLPLTNPYVFAADGGTPLWANSQSAPLYPLNAIFWLLPPGALWWGFGLSAALHLLIAAVGVYRLARSLGLSRGPAFLSASAFSLSGPVICWLALPTFLCVACWLPWLLLLLKRAIAHPQPTQRGWAVLGAGVVGGLSLLGGHLQIAFYVLTTGFLWTLYLMRENRASARRSAPGLLAALAVALCLAAPQVVPSVELSRSSHRAAAAKPSADGYRSYTALALPPRSLTTLLFPDYFGHPIDGTHWNDSEVMGMVAGGNNYAEWACYVGIVPLALGVFALFLPWKRTDTGLFRLRRPLAGLLALSLGLALGTPLNALLYFGLPGFSQTGSPARVLVVVVLALSLLAGVGLQLLSDSSLPAPQRRRAFLLGLVTLAFLGAIGAALSVQWLTTHTNVAFAAVIRDGMRDIAFGLGLLVLASIACLVLPTREKRFLPVSALLIGLALVDLVPRALRYNPGAAPSDVFPETPGIRYLKENARGALIAPLNVGWSMGHISPKSVLPPNALSVFGLRDAGGYDSLFLAASRERLKEANQGIDPAPPQNGNMAFVKSFQVARTVGASYIVVHPKIERRHDELEMVYQGTDMAIYKTGASSAPPAPPPPTVGLRVGAFLGALGLAALAGWLVALRGRIIRHGA